MNINNFNRDVQAEVLLCDMELSFKLVLLEQCTRILEERIARAKAAMDSAQESANQEDKSSAGDKYETGRAMSQLDRDMNARQMAEAMAALKDLGQIRIGDSGKVTVPGSLIRTEAGLYFIAAAIGPIEADQLKVIVISPQAPLAKLMLGKQKGDIVAWNGRTFTIAEIL